MNKLRKAFKNKFSPFKTGKSNTTSKDELFFEKLLQCQNPVVFDVGSNTGQSINLFKSRFPECIIHAFEPTPDCYQALLENINYKDVTINEVAISNTVGSKKFYINRKSVSNSMLELNSESLKHAKGMNYNINSIEVKTTTLDYYCGKSNINKIDLLKLDTQGHELECLQGAHNLLENSNIDIIQTEIIFGSEYHKSISFYDIESFLFPFGYKLFTLFNLKKSPVNFFLNHLDAVYVSEDVFSRNSNLW